MAGIDSTTNSIASKQKVLINIFEIFINTGSQSKVPQKTSFNFQSGEKASQANASFFNTLQRLPFLYSIHKTSNLFKSGIGQNKHHRELNAYWKTNETYTQKNVWQKAVGRKHIHLFGADG